MDKQNKGEFLEEGLKWAGNSGANMNFFFRNVDHYLKKEWSTRFENQAWIDPLPRLLPCLQKLRNPPIQTY